MGLQFILGDATTDHTQTMAAMIHEKLPLIPKTGFFTGTKPY